MLLAAMGFTAMSKLFSNRLDFALARCLLVPLSSELLREGTELRPAELHWLCTEPSAPTQGSGTVSPCIPAALPASGSDPCAALFCSAHMGTGCCPLHLPEVWSASRHGNQQGCISQCPPAPPAPSCPDVHQGTAAWQKPLSSLCA